MALEITDELVQHIARLSRLAISKKELDELKEHFRKILAYVAELQALDTQSVDPSLTAVRGSPAARVDDVAPSLGAEEALRNAPEAHPPYFSVPRLVGRRSEGCDEGEDDLGGGP